MPGRTRNTDRLSRQLIVEAAVGLLDAEGEGGLTFRALSAQLKTGPGAIYWHVANKNELLAAATDAVLVGALAADATEATPEDAIRAVALALFDAIDNHPWIGAQLAQIASQTATLQIFERIGSQVQALGVAGQNAAHARAVPPGTTRSDVLGTESAVWASLDLAEYPFLRNVAAQLREHDDRAQFLAGVDLILAGITALRPRA